MFNRLWPFPRFAQLSDAAKQALQQDFARSDHLMMTILVAHWVLASTLMASDHGYYLMGFIGGAVICLLAYGGMKLLPGTAY